MTKRRTKVIITSIFMCGATLALLATTQVTPVNAETTTSENSEVVAKDNTNRIPVESLANAEEYASSLLSTDESVQISNAKITGSTNSITKFDDASEHGMKDGILLSTKEINGSDDYLDANDADIEKLVNSQLTNATAETHDAISLEFDFVPKYSEITFNYIFGSDEYPTYVGSDFNDTFAFFLNGKNIALVPNTNDFVSINNVNNGNIYNKKKIEPKNSEYFVDNQSHYLPIFSGNNADGELNFGGVTKLLPATASVKAGENNHIKLVIADLMDKNFDSFIAISAKSFKSVPSTGNETPTKPVVEPELPSVQPEVPTTEPEIIEVDREIPTPEPTKPVLADKTPEVAVTVESKEPIQTQTTTSTAAQLPQTSDDTSKSLILSAFGSLMLLFSGVLFFRKTKRS